MFGVRGVLCGMGREGVYRGDKVHRRGLFVGAKLPSYQAQFLAPSCDRRRSNYYGTTRRRVTDQYALAPN